MKLEVAERIVLSTELDPWLSLRALAAYSGLSIRTLRAHLTDPFHPLPCYRVGAKIQAGAKVRAKILVRRSEFDAWMLKHRLVGAADIDRLMAEIFEPRPERTH